MIFLFVSLSFFFSFVVLRTEDAEKIIEICKQNVNFDLDQDEIITKGSEISAANLVICALFCKKKKRIPPQLKLGYCFFLVFFDHLGLVQINDDYIYTGHISYEKLEEWCRIFLAYLFGVLKLKAGDVPDLFKLKDISMNDVVEKCRDIAKIDVLHKLYFVDWEDLKQRKQDDEIWGDNGLPKLEDWDLIELMPCIKGLLYQIGFNSS